MRSEHELVERGHEAQRLLNDPFLQLVTEELVTDTVEEWKSAKDTASREAVHAKYSALAALQDRLQLIVAQGEHAAAKLGLDGEDIE